MASQHTIILGPGTPLVERVNRSSSETDQGLDLRSLQAGTVVNVYTRHSCYRLLVTDPGAGLACVTGGSMFPQTTDVRVEGAMVDGGIQARRIAVGLRLELWDGSKRITTSVVQSLAIDP